MLLIAVISCAVWCLTKFPTMHFTANYLSIPIYSRNIATNRFPFQFCSQLFRTNIAQCTRPFVFCHHLFCFILLFDGAACVCASEFNFYFILYVEMSS